MARIRTIKPDAFTSESLSSVDFFTRWMFAGLWTYLDDEGYGKADPRLVRAALFPLDDEVTVAQVATAIDALVCTGSLCLYEVDGRQYLHAPNWTEHQRINRPSASKLPHCPRCDETGIGAPVGTLSDASVSPHRVTTESSLGEKEKERKGKEPSSTDVDGVFTDFWAAYPRKVAKAEAKRAWTQLIKAGHDPTAILVGLKRLAPQWANYEPNFIPHPASWLRGERWNDQPAPRASVRDEWAHVPVIKPGGAR